MDSLGAARRLRRADVWDGMGWHGRASVRKRVRAGVFGEGGSSWCRTLISGSGELQARHWQLRGNATVPWMHSRWLGWVAIGSRGFIFEMGCPRKSNYGIRVAGTAAVVGLPATRQTFAPLAMEEALDAAGQRSCPCPMPMPSGLIAGSLCTDFATSPAGRWRQARLPRYARVPPARKACQGASLFRALRWRGGRLPPAAAADWRAVE